MQVLLKYLENNMQEVLNGPFGFFLMMAVILAVLATGINTSSKLENEVLFEMAEKGYQQCLEVPNMEDSRHNEVLWKKECE